MNMTVKKIELIHVNSLLHIEGHSKKRVLWLADKILQEQVWTKPIVIDDEHNLVLDGQHRMEVAKKLGFKLIPAVKYNYSDVKVWSLRPNYDFDWELVVSKALSHDIYPYKTVKHEFPEPLPTCSINLKDLL